MRICIVLLLLSLSLPLNSHAKQMGVDYLAGEYSTSGIRVALQPMEPQRLPLWNLNWHLEASFNRWQQNAGDEHQQVNVLALSPVITRQFAALVNRPVFWELGIGVSLLDERLFAHKNMGSHFQFEDRIGVVLKVSDEHTLSLRYMHYSNAGLASNNPGMDFLSLSYRRGF